MPLKFKRKVPLFLKKIKRPFGLWLIFFLILTVVLLQSKPKFSLWWSVLFTNPLRQTDGLTNILILGVSGGVHQGADLTDTMIFLSFNQKTGKTFLFSLPRDIWSPTLVAKINTAYHYGEEKEPKSGGLVLAKSTVEEIVGLPVHYAFKINLSGFKEIIDLVGGVEVEVERAFDDYKFPIEGKENDPCGGDKEYKCRYQHIHFEAGRQLLNGERALQYVRSRQAEGEEGTDFARSHRQQKLIFSLKERIFSPQFLLSPKKIFQLIKILKEFGETDIPQEQLPYFGKMLIKIGSSQIKTLSLDEFLVNPPLWQYGQWVLVPRSGDFGEIQKYLKEQILK